MDFISRVQEGLAKGVHPLRLTRGRSGVYLLRDIHQRPLAIFKPFDEEMTAHLCGPLEATYHGMRSGEGFYRECAAFFVSEKIGLDIVPFTTQASLDFPDSSVKLGSLQQWKEGRFPKWEEIPVEEVHKLFILDVIIGQWDRFPDNALFDGKQLIAIDHALSFSFWPWRVPQAWLGLWQMQQPFRYGPPNFLTDKFWLALHKRCKLSMMAIDLCKERVGLLCRQMEQKKTPYELCKLYG